VTALPKLNGLTGQVWRPYLMAMRCITVAGAYRV
jgi:hypothetical protein